MWLLIGEDLIESQSWTMGVVLLITVGAVLLSCACAVFDLHFPTGTLQVTSEPAIAMEWSCTSPRAMQDDDVDHVNERTWILSWYSGNQLWQLMVFNTAEFVWEVGTVLAAHCHHE